ncbi:MAG TPA: AbrB/MazE/SpoVT family DNA-binding domain-containing protein [Candidatus Nanoarchaeia archaeon]|nr:AbrB/MazE/SpoVT family DNA-binding domain-containing protein [Candidatus Nanoarchaeia archaeon]
METDLVKMSPKGQLVVPQDLRELAGFLPGDRFAPFPVKEGILFKRIIIPDVKAEFAKLSKEIEKQFKKQGVTPRDIDEAVKWARRKSS